MSYFSHCCHSYISAAKLLIENTFWGANKNTHARSCRSLSSRFAPVIHANARNPHPVLSTPPPPPSLPVCTAEWEAGFPRQGLKWGSRGPGNVSLFVLFICIKHGKAELFSFHIGYLPWSLWTRSFQNQFSLINGHFILGVWLVSQKASWWTIVFLKCSPSKPQKQKQHQRLSLTKWCCCVISLWIFLLVACHQDIDPYPGGGDVKSALCDATKSGF